MYNLDNETLVAWPKYVMICGGLWRLPITHNQTLKIVYYIYAFIMQLGYCVFWLTLTCELIRLIIYKYEWPVIAVSLGVVCNASKVVMKLIIYHKYNIPELFAQVIEKEKEIWESNDEVKKMYKRMVMTCKFYILLLTGSTVFVVTVLEVTGAMATVQIRDYNRAHNVSLEPHFMYQSILPLDKLKNLYVTFGMQVYWAFAGAIHNYVTQIIFVALLVYATSRLKFLQNKLKNYLEPDFSQDVSKEQMEAKIQILKKLIIDHQDVIEFITNFNKRLQYIILLEFVLTSLDLASVSVMIIKGDQVIWLLTFFVLLLTQISLIGWNCNEIKVQSEAIADAAFESGWHLLNKEGKILIHLLIVRAQKPLLMTIGPFGPMTLNSVLMVIKAAYSYVSIMKEEK